MAPIKFEEHLKEKLEGRTIQPSEEAWKTLANRLDQNDKGQSRKTIWWLGVAASIVGIALVAILIFDGSPSTAIKPTIVDTEKIEEVKSNVVASEHVETFQPETATNKEQDMKASTQENLRPKKTNFTKEQMVLKEAIASTDVEGQKPIMNSSEAVERPSDFEESKLHKVVAEIQRRQTGNEGVSEAEIDALLKKAEREILTNRIRNETDKTVDANALLQEVEDELEQTFRTKVFEALLNNYETVRTAVAERNN